MVGGLEGQGGTLYEFVEFLNNPFKIDVNHQSEFGSNRSTQDPSTDTCCRLPLLAVVATTTTTILCTPSNWNLRCSNSRYIYMVSTIVPHPSKTLSVPQLQMSILCRRVRNTRTCLCHLADDLSFPANTAHRLLAMSVGKIMSLGTQRHGTPIATPAGSLNFFPDGVLQLLSFRCHPLNIPAVICSSIMFPLRSSVKMGTDHNVL